MQSPFAPTTHKQKKLSHKKMCALLPTQYKGHSHCQKKCKPQELVSLPSNCQAKQACIHCHTHSTPKTENHKQHVHTYTVSSVVGQRVHHNRQQTQRGTTVCSTSESAETRLRPIQKLLSNAAPRPCGSCKNRKNIIHRWIGRVPKRLGEKS